MPRTVDGCDFSRAVLDLRSLPDAAPAQVVRSRRDHRLAPHPPARRPHRLRSDQLLRRPAHRGARGVRSCVPADQSTPSLRARSRLRDPRWTGFLPCLKGYHLTNRQGGQRRDAASDERAELRNAARRVAGRRTDAEHGAERASWRGKGPVLLGQPCDCAVELCDLRAEEFDHSIDLLSDPVLPDARAGHAWFGSPGFAEANWWCWCCTGGSPCHEPTLLICKSEPWWHCSMAPAAGRRRSGMPCGLYCGEVVSTAARHGKRRGDQAARGAMPQAGVRALLSPVAHCLSRIAEHPSITRALAAELAARGIHASHMAVWRLIRADSMRFKSRTG